MNKQGNVRNSQSATPLFFERREEEETVSQPSKRQREEPEHQTIVINTPSLNGNSSTLVQETLEVPACNNKLKEKLALKLNSLNDIKARYESQKFLNKMSQRKKLYRKDYLFT